MGWIENAREVERSVGATGAIYGLGRLLSGERPRSVGQSGRERAGKGPIRRETKTGLRGGQVRGWAG